MGAPAENEAIAAGAELGGRFYVHALLGQGGMGAVYAVWDRDRQREVALKIMRRDLSSDGKALARFQREGELLQRARHPGIVAADETGVLPDGRAFLVLELLRGETLADHLRRVERIDAETLATILDAISDALDAAHGAGLVHRDIKPSNIFLVDTAQAPASAPVRLLDFGVAKSLDLERLTSTGIVVGTVLYMAPEQLAGLEVDARADVYSLGVVLYQALTGRHPFAAVDGSNLSTAILIGRAAPMSGVGHAIAAVVSRAMARSPADRFPSAPALASAFRSAVSGVPVLDAQTAGTPRLARAIAEQVGEMPTVPVTREIPRIVVPHARDAIANAPTDPADGALAPVPLPPPGSLPGSSSTRPRKKASPVFGAFLTVPLLLMCLVTGLGAVSCNACASLMKESEMEQMASRLRTAFARSPNGAAYEADLAALERLHDSGETDWSTMALLRSELDEMTGDGELEESELAFVMGRVRDAVSHGGSFPWGRFWEIVGESAERQKNARR